MLNTIGRTRAGVLVYTDKVTGEEVWPFQPIVFEDDFIGAQHSAAYPTAAQIGFPWIKKIVGAAPPTVAGAPNSVNGVVNVTLAANSEAEDALLYQADQLAYSLAQGLVFEALVKFPVLPTGVAQLTLGVGSAWITGGADNFVNSAYFTLYATNAGQVSCRINDSTAGAPIVALSGVTMDTTNFHLFKIDASDPSGISFFIDGSRVATGTAFPFTAASGAAAAQVQPFIQAVKASGTGIGTISADFVRVSQRRS